MTDTLRTAKDLEGTCYWKLIIQDCQFHVCISEINVCITIHCLLFNILISRNASCRFSSMSSYLFDMFICEVREKTNKMQQLDVYYQHFLNRFRASLCPSSGDQDVCYCTWCAALVLLDVVVSGCGALCTTQRPTTATNI